MVSIKKLLPIFTYHISNLNKYRIILKIETKDIYYNDFELLGISSLFNNTVDVVCTKQNSHELHFVICLFV